MTDLENIQLLDIAIKKLESNLKRQELKMQRGTMPTLLLLLL